LKIKIHLNFIFELAFEIIIIEIRS
jgi:hypothetical protein